MVNKLSYEEERRKRIEENKKKMEGFNLSKLSRALHISAKSSPMKKVKPRARKEPVELSALPVRRSSRFEGMPPKSYTEIPMEALGPARKYSSGRTRDLANRVYASDEEREYATLKAEELQSSLDQRIPSFVKPMLQSHVTGGFWLGLPKDFCDDHLPQRDEMMMLVDEEEGEFPSKYLAQKNGLSAGWRGFAIEHELVDGDALVFQLVQPLTFKVFIIRVNKTGEVG